MQKRGVLAKVYMGEKPLSRDAERQLAEELTSESAGIIPPINPSTHEVMLTDKGERVIRPANSE